MKCIAVLGATATGKSTLALRLAHHLGGEIVNADALQVYRGFDIGTAKPSPEELETVRHHLVDILDPTEPYSAGDFARQAMACIEDITQRGRVPLVVGGSGLYLRALLEGLAEMPSIPDEVRAFYLERLELVGLPALRRELQHLDPDVADRLTPGDTQRTLRALEVRRATGRPLSWWQRRPTRPPGDLEVFKVGLIVPRAHLYDKIALRAQAMISAGWLDEVGRLLETVPLDAPAFQAIGYRELGRAIAAVGSVPPPEGPWPEEIEQAVAQTVLATRRYAKRQETWFRKESEVLWLNPLEDEPTFEELVEELKSHAI